MNDIRSGDSEKQMSLTYTPFLLVKFVKENLRDFFRFEPKSIIFEKYLRRWRHEFLRKSKFDSNVVELSPVVSLSKL